MQNYLHKSNYSSFKINNLYDSKISLHNELIEGNNFNGLLYVFPKTFQYMENELNINRYDIVFEFIESHYFSRKSETDIIDELFYKFLKNANFFNNKYLTYYALHEITSILCKLSNYNLHAASINFNQINNSFWTIVNYPEFCKNLFNIKSELKRDSKEIKVLYISSQKGFYTGIINKNIERYLHLYSGSVMDSDLNIESVFMKIGLT